MKVTLEEIAANLADPNICKTENWIAGAIWQAKQMYSEEEVYNIVEQAIKNYGKNQLGFFDGGVSNPIYTNLKKWFDQFKKK